MTHCRVEVGLMGMSGRASLKPIVAFRCSVPDADAEEFGRFLRMHPYGPGIDVQIYYLAPEEMLEPAADTPPSSQSGPAVPG